MKKKTKRVSVIKEKKYEWKSGASVHNQAKLDVQAVGEELERITAQHGHKLNAKDLVNEASVPTSPLHDAFEWDDTEAARAHREEQARKLLRSVTITIVRENKPDVVVRGFLSVENNDGRTSTYGATSVLMSDDEMRALLLKQAIQKLIAVRKHYAQLSELAQVFNMIDQLAQKTG